MGLCRAELTQLPLLVLNRIFRRRFSSLLPRHSIDVVRAFSGKAFTFEFCEFKGLLFKSHFFFFWRRKHIFLSVHIISKTVEANPFEDRKESTSCNIHYVSLFKLCICSYQDEKKLKPHHITWARFWDKNRVPLQCSFIKHIIQNRILTCFGFSVSWKSSCSCHAPNQERT